MKRYVPYEKLSSKKKRELDSKMRGEWGVIRPGTRKIESEKLYNRKKLRRPMDDGSAGVFLCLKGV